MRTFNNIARTVREKRLKAGMSQCDLSYKLKYKNGQFISNCERGLCSIPLKKVPLLAAILDAKIDDFKDAIIKDTSETIDNFSKENAVIR